MRIRTLVAAAVAAAGLSRRPDGRRGRHDHGGSAAGRPRHRHLRGRPGERPRSLRRSGRRSRSGALVRSRRELSWSARRGLSGACGPCRGSGGTAPWSSSGRSRRARSRSPASASPGVRGCRRTGRRASCPPDRRCRQRPRRRSRAADRLGGAGGAAWGRSPRAACPAARGDRRGPACDGGPRGVDGRRRSRSRSRLYRRLPQRPLRPSVSGSPARATRPRRMTPMSPTSGFRRGTGRDAAPNGRWRTGGLTACRLQHAGPAARRAARSGDLSSGPQRFPGAGQRLALRPAR
jgi:hypothetical protein